MICDVDGVASEIPQAGHCRRRPSSGLETVPAASELYRGPALYFAAARQAWDGNEKSRRLEAIRLEVWS